MKSDLEVICYILHELVDAINSGEWGKEFAAEMHQRIGYLEGELARRKEINPSKVGDEG